MKSGDMDRHFKNLKEQREHFYHEFNIENPWQRPMPDKWSTAETLYHLILMVRLFRRFSRVYVPAMLPVAYLRRKKPYKTDIHNIYEEYQHKKRKPMNAPFLLKPPSNLERKYTFSDIQDLLEVETEKLETKLSDIDQDLAGQIYYPDPVAHNPNLIQSIHLLGIHEQHHFNILKKYFLTYYNNTKETKS
ncbi:DinB family protein [Tenuibacillus multivorans]|uniref:DinB superfamily protein n=1 Tax=Tenuibacillus multivorans TaxID=237069 RepID=A0A1G9X6R1_9BACI|nr:DinB family protein [Tenuibacillus multivorans]GEL78647.1 membrane protein [Tenuibacillus multivorans]SDM92033.1 DinB superfamily protein [Tenuibacillus multivorans]